MRNWKYFWTKQSYNVQKMLKIKEKRVLAGDKKIDIKHAFMYNNEIVKVSLFYDRLIIQIDDSGIKMSE